MTITVPVWLLWLLAVPVTVLVVFLAVFGVAAGLMLRAIARGL